MSLTDKELQALKPKEKSYKKADGHGLYIEVLPSGGKSWRLKYRIGGIEKRITLGLYPVVSLKKARDKAHEARGLLSDGVDPGQAKKDIAIVAKASSSTSKTFTVVLNELLAVKTKRVSEKHISDYKRSMEMHVLPCLGKKDITEIKASEIIELGQKTEDAGLYLAHRIIQRIGEVMDYAVTLGYREMNPVTKKTHTILTQHVRKNNPAIEFKYMPEFLHDLSKYRGYPTTIGLLKFVMFSGCRTGEARDLRWTWVDFEKRLISIPPEFHKSGRTAIRKGKTGKALPWHLIPISSQILEVLQEVQEITKNSGDKFVFPLYRNYALKASENVLSGALANIAGGKWKGRQSGHGFRGLAKTSWKESELWSYDAMELQLAHAYLTATEEAYDSAKLLDSRTKMLSWWGSKIIDAEVSKIVDLKTAPTVNRL